MAGSAWTNQVQNLVLVAGTGAGVFVYDPTAGAGNLIASMTDAAADPFGNVTAKGVNSYATVVGLSTATGLNLTGSAGQPGLSVGIDTAAGPASPPGVFGLGSSSGTPWAVARLSSGKVTAGDVLAEVLTASQSFSGDTNGHVLIQAGLTEVGPNHSLTVNDNTGAVTATLGSAATPTLITTDSWHSITPGGTWTASGSGVNGFFYRLLSTGDVLLAWDVSNNNANPGTLGTLPAGYRPATTVRLQSGWTGTGPAAYNNQFAPMIQVSSAGAITGGGLFVATLTLFGTAVLPIGSL